MSNDKLLDKLGKLKAKEISARNMGNVEEAETFAAKVVELCLKYQIELSEVEVRDQAASEPIEMEYVSPPDGRKKARVWWQEYLAQIIAENNMCKTMCITGSNTVVFVGRKTHREICVYIFTYLVREVSTYVNREYDREYNKLYDNGYDTSPMKGWKRSFLQGFITRLQQRLQEQRAEMEREAGTKFALVKTTDTAVAAFVKDRGKGKAGHVGQSSSRHNHHGYVAGKKFADKVQPGKAVGGSTQPASKKIGGR